MTSKFLSFFRIFIPLVFEVKKPVKPLSFNKKVLYTLLALCLYLVMLSTPVYGPNIDPDSQDPFFALRAILASQRGTLAELGIGPIVTAGMILQLLVGSKIISVNFQDPNDKMLYSGTQKILAILMTIFEAIAFIAGGAYGPDVQGDLGLQVLIVIQLTLAGIAIMMMDELIQKGYGLGSGISLFIAASVSFQVFRGAFNLNTVESNITGEIYYSGAVLFFFQSLWRNNIWEGLWHPEIFNSSDMFNLLATVVVFAVVIYFESMRIEIPVQHSQHRIPARYPIKFLYTSNIPVILVAALFANIYLISNLADNTWGGSAGPGGTFARFMGVWDTEQGQRIPVGGVAAYTTAPFGLLDVYQRPIQALVYMILMVIMCTAFAMIWVETAGMSSSSVARQLINADMQIPGFRRSPKIIEKYLDNYIPYAAFLGGMFIGLLASIADFLGAIGTGTGILLTTGIIRQYYEILAKEKLADINPGVANLLGIK
jgi:preprotein translocase SecY subunit